MPRESISYTGLANQWIAAPGVSSISESLIRDSRFALCWAEKGATLRELKLHVRQCLSEKSGMAAVVYSDGAAMLEAIIRVLLTTELGGDPGQAFFFIDKAGGPDGLRPDVAWCGMSRDVSPLALHTSGGGLEGLAGPSWYQGMPIS